MVNNIIDRQIINDTLMECGVSSINDASIRDVVKVVNTLERKTGVKFIRMEMGVPGLPPSEIGKKAEIKAIEDNAPQFYPMLEGTPELAKQASKFIKNFMDVNLDAKHITPTVGSMQGAYVSFMAATACKKEADTVLFIDPGFSVQKTQMQVIGKPYTSFDIYNYRGEKLEQKLREFMNKGNICAIVYSNPNNPTWVCLTEEELAIIGRLATEYDVIVIEDLAYFAMDFRKDLSHPGKAPFQPTVAHYTDNYILLISSSKLFNYAGQRLGLLCVSDKLFDRNYEGLKERFGSAQLGYTLIYKLIYTQTSGTAHSPQYALAAIFKAANEGELNILSGVQEYGERAHKMKQIYQDAGFHIVYDKDGDENISDGFYFTIIHPTMNADELATTLLHYGVSSLTLKNFGSKREGLRACVSQVSLNDIQILKERINLFKQDYN